MKLNIKAVLMAISMIVLATGTLLPISTPSVLASEDKDNEKDKDRFNEKDFQIVKFGLDKDDNPYLKVKGEAGGSTPDDENTIYAYVFFVEDEDQTIYAVTSHEIEDSTEVGDDIQYHAHKVELDDDNCVTSLEEDGEAELEGKRVTVEGTDATDVNGVLTAELTIDNDGNVCVEEVFDSKGL